MCRAEGKASPAKLMGSVQSLCQGRQALEIRAAPAFLYGKSLSYAFGHCDAVVGEPR